MSITDGGYDDGYQAVPCFWGTRPGSLIAEHLKSHPRRPGALALDLGCGEGKNAAALTRAGYLVDAVECSRAAINNGRHLFSDLDINWLEADVREVQFPQKHYDIVVAYGLYHCLRGSDEISLLIDRTKDATRPGGHHLICVFNDGSHDLRAHPGLHPTLASHGWYLSKYSDWSLVSATDSILKEIHPHNNIPHHHSLTRLTARRPR
jgi:tellurite methyltransferase